MNLYEELKTVQVDSFPEDGQFYCPSLARFYRIPSEATKSDLRSLVQVILDDIEESEANVLRILTEGEE